MKNLKKLTALMAAFIFALAFAVVKPEKVQAADYTVTVGHGKVYSDKEGNNEITGPIPENTQVYIYMDSSNFVWSQQDIYIYFLIDDQVGGADPMFSNPITVTKNLRIAAVVAPFEEYVIDLSADTVVLDYNMLLERPFLEPINVTLAPVGARMDVDGDNQFDYEVIANDTANNKQTLKKLDTCSIPDGYISTRPEPGYKYGKMVYKMTANNGGNKNTANESGATTNDTPADPNKADLNKAPKTGESNAFVLSMLGIIAVAGMGLYVGKKQEN